MEIEVIRMEIQKPGLAAGLFFKAKTASNLPTRLYV